MRSIVREVESVVIFRLGGVMKILKVLFAPVRFIAKAWKRLGDFLEQQDKLVSPEERDYASDAEFTHLTGQ